MYKFLLALLLGVSALQLWGQTTRVDSLALHAPVFQSIESLLAYCHQNVSKQDHARFYFIWISKHIRYDYEFLEITPDSLKGQRLKPAYVFNVGKTSCFGYAALFEHLCYQSDIPNWVVTGYSNLSGVKSLHAWNLVRVDKQWHFMDPTWGADFYLLDSAQISTRLNAQFYAEPMLFALEHEPFDSMLTLVNTGQDFALPHKFLDKEWALDSTLRIWKSAGRGWRNFPNDSTAATDFGNAQYVLIEMEMNVVAADYNTWMNNNQLFEQPLSRKKAAKAISAAEALRARANKFHSMNLQLDQLWSSFNSANALKMEQRNKFEGFDQMMADLILRLKKVE